MAQPALFYSYGGMQVTKGTSYTTANLPSALINTVVISEAPRIFRKKYNQDGTTIQDVRGLDEYAEGSQRGVWILIKRTGVTYTIPNVPVLYKEGDEIVLHADNTYTFLGNCVIEFGAKV